MDIFLTPKMDTWITEKVATGMYGSSNEVIYEGLRLLKRQEEQRQVMIDDLRNEVLVGVRQLDAGKADTFNSSLVAEIKTIGRTKLGL